MRDEDNDMRRMVKCKRHKYIKFETFSWERINKVGKCIKGDSV